MSETNLFYQQLEEQSGPDYVKVVRCKDCDWWTKQIHSLQGRCALSGSYPTGEWFCANGEIHKPSTVIKTPQSRWIPSENREFDEAYGIVCSCPDCGAEVIGNYAVTEEDECCSYEFCPYCGHAMRGASENDPHQ